MKPTHHQILNVTSRPGMILALGLFALPAAAITHAAPPAPCAVAELELNAVLESARTAAKREAWSAVKNGLFFSGMSDTGGVDAEFELFLTADGRYRYQAVGPLARTLTFDGEDVALRVRSGPTQVLELADRETWQLSEWIHSGYWLSPDCPIAIALAGETDDSVTLHLSFPGSASPARLVLDRASWLPRELGLESMGGENILQFKQYKVVAGIPIAHFVRSQSHGEANELRVLEAREASVDSGARFERNTGPAEDVHFDLDRPASVELRRTRSGHLLVHPRVDGKDVGWFILDSGAGQICIDPKVADKLELEEFGSVPAVGVAGTVQASFRQGETLELGPMTLDDPIYVEI